MTKDPLSLDPENKVHKYKALDEFQEFILMRCSKCEVPIFAHNQIICNYCNAVFKALGCDWEDED